MSTPTAVLTLLLVIVSACQDADQAPPPPALAEQGPPPVIYGEDIGQACPIDVDIHLPAAQNPAQPLVAEGPDATDGAWTLRNDDMDPPTAEILTARLQNGNDLLSAEGRPDLLIAGAITGENDLVAVDVHNPTALANVFLNVYAMAAQTSSSAVASHPNNQPANRIQRRLAVWKGPDRAAAAPLPYPVPGPAPDRVWVEGLGAGRYRFVLMHIPNGTPAQAGQVKASEVGSPHGRTTAGQVTLTPPAGVQITCHVNVRLTVGVSDIHQQGRREHLFDVLWGGRPVFNGRVWPGGGAWTWSQSQGFNGQWLQGNVHGVAVAPNGNAPGAHNAIHKAAGAFEPVVQPIGPISGSGRYEHRARLEYQVEGATLTRDEPVTLMVPDHITFTPLGQLANGIGVPHWGGTYSFDLQARYDLFDQHNRALAGPSQSAYRRQYGTNLKAYEALGMGVMAAEAGDNVSWNFVSPANPALTFTVPIGTKQRSRAVPQNGNLSDGRFTDSFRLSINQGQRAMLQNVAIAGRTVFSVSQDVVILLENGATDYDVRVARGQRLEILAPRPPAGAVPWSGLGFMVTLGNGAQPNTGNPDRVANNHNPPPP